MISVEKFVFNFFSENTYVVWDNNSGEGMVIDPGCSNEHEENVIKNFILGQNINLKYIVNTHAHIDHIIGNYFFKENYLVEFLGSEKDNFILEMLEDLGHKYGIRVKRSPLPDKYIKEDEIIKLGESEVNFLFTPGHSPGEFCLYIPEENICFTGDVLFRESIGRTDLWGGDYDTLLQSINEKLFTLPDSTKILPGHGDDSTIGYEKKHNPFL